MNDGTRFCQCSAITAQFDDQLTCNRADSSQMSSLVGHRSQPILMIFLAATILPACSSTHAAAIQPGACFGFDFTRESKSILARLMSLQGQPRVSSFNKA